MSNVIKCSQCGNELKGGAKFCSQCGQKIEDSPRVDICPNPKCGTKLSVDEKFCPKCGTNISSATSDISSEKKSETDEKLHQPPTDSSSESPSKAQPRYIHPQGWFDIAVPPPWTASEKNLWGLQFTLIDRPDIRYEGFTGKLQNMFRNVLPTAGPASLRVNFMSYNGHLDCQALRSNFYNSIQQWSVQLQVTPESRALVQTLSPLINNAPSREQRVDFENSVGVAYDIETSMFGFFKTINRDFVTIFHTSQQTLGAILQNTANTNEEFARWEESLWQIASSFKFP